MVVLFYILRCVSVYLFYSKVTRFLQKMGIYSSILGALLMLQCLPSTKQQNLEGGVLVHVCIILTLLFVASFDKKCDSRQIAEKMLRRL
jgi:hypothetical protein